MDGLSEDESSKHFTSTSWVDTSFAAKPNLNALDQFIKIKKFLDEHGIDSNQILDGTSPYLKILQAAQESGKFIKGY